MPERYEPLRRVARGGMASVWCALDHTLDRQVAIKVLAEPYAHDELAGRRFTREARAAARLSGHANVVTIYDVCRALPSQESPLGRPFIVMEYLAGGTLADALRTRELDRTMILAWLHQAAAALDYAHRRGVIHRDVKLSNFLLDRERVLHVADFGIAQLGTEDTLTVSGQVLGTAAYLAPERALGLPATEASDRYALAVAAFELLTGERPFTAEPFTAQARQHVEQPPPPASERNQALPTALDAVLTRGMAKRPEERFPTSRELVEGIEQALARPRKRAASGRRTAAPPSLTVYGSHGRGRIVAFSALTAVLLGVAIAAGVTLIPTGPHSSSSSRTHPLYAQGGAAGQSSGHAAADRPGAARHASSTGTTPAVASTLPTTAAPTQPRLAPEAMALEARGHQLMVGGDYHSAIPVLRRAVAAAPRSSLTYAYALYDLGRSLRLAGDPRDAVQILWRRLQIPNQTGVVRNELTLALQALGQSQASNPGTGDVGVGSASTGGAGMGNAGAGNESTSGAGASNAGADNAIGDGNEGNGGTGGSGSPAHGSGAQDGGSGGHHGGGPPASAQPLIGQAGDVGD